MQIFYLFLYVSCVNPTNSTVAAALLLLLATWRFMAAGASVGLLVATNGYFVVVAHIYTLLLNVI